MSLSLKKLQKMLLKFSFMTENIFHYDEKVVFVECISNKNGEKLLMYIPSRYDIPVGMKRNNFYELDYLDVKEDGTIAGDYAGNPEDIEETYESVDLELRTDGKKSDKVIEELEDQYNLPLSLKDITKEDTNELRQIFRQLNRLKLCVKNVNYKMSVIFKNYLCCIRRDDTLEGFLVKGYRGNRNAKLIISIDLEAFYKHSDNISYDIKTLRKGIYNVLDKNQIKHTKNLNRVLEQRKLLSVSSNNILHRKDQYKIQIEKIEKMLEKLDKAEDDYIEKIEQINQKYTSESSYRGVHNDIDRNNETAQYYKNLDEIAETKKQLNTIFTTLKEHHENLALKVDKICFDNTVMLSAIVQNFNLLGQI